MVAVLFMSSIMYSIHAAFVYSVQVSDVHFTYKDIVEDLRRIYTYRNFRSEVLNLFQIHSY